MYLYKYFDPSGVDCLLNRRLKVTPPNRFNDPFEFTPHMVGSLSEQSAEEFLRNKQMRKELYITAKRENPQLQWRSFKEDLYKNRDRHIKLLIEKAHPEALKALTTKNIEHISEDYGLICFSKNPCSLLMWSHYAQSHEGFTICFDTNEGFLQKTKLIEVQYKKERPCLNPLLKIGTPERSEAELNSIRTKSLEWGYEEEMRAVYELNSCIKEIEKGTINFHISIPVSCIRKIVLGYRCNAGTGALIRKTVSESDFRHVLLEKAELHPDEYRLVFQKVS